MSEQPPLLELPEPEPGIPDAALRFVVHGKPEPAGSKKGYIVGKPPRQHVNIVDDNDELKPWQAKVREHVAGELPDDFDVWDGPVSLNLTFYRPRNVGHFGTGRNAGVVLPSAPPYPHTVPDALKLARGVEDALTGVLWANDSRIVDEHLFKRWGPAQVVIVAWPL